MKFGTEFLPAARYFLSLFSESRYFVAAIFLATDDAAVLWNFHFIVFGFEF